MATVEQVAFPFYGESDTDELDVIDASTRSTTVVGDATPPNKTPRKMKLDTLIIPAPKGKRLRTHSLSEKDNPLAGNRKKQKMENRKAVRTFLPAPRPHLTDMSLILFSARIGSSPS